MKNLLITGGSGGIGQGIVKKFIEEGYFVYVLDTDTVSSKALIETFGKDKCRVDNVSVIDAKALTDYAKSLGENFELNCLITCAGRALNDEWKPFEEQSLETVKNSIELNLIGHINVIHTFLPALKRAKGDKSILLISSINAESCFGLPSYSASKSGLYGFVNSTVKEFGACGIRINSLSPGTIITTATSAEPKNFASLLKGTALGRFATVKNVADTAFAICDTIDGITGQNIVVDAGQSKCH
ncbi:MAG: SDR family oxidoreductase [Clostridia bacterium]|nr:SDR family oxidoreductase [Clostridia bacterium]